MTDDPTGVALREHLDEILGGVTPSPALLDGIRAGYDRRMRRRATALACGSALTVAAATVAVLLTPTVGNSRQTTHPGGRPSVGPTPTVTAPVPPDYPPAEPSEKLLTGPFAFPRPSGEIARFRMNHEPGDRAGSRRTLLVWYNAPKDVFCAVDVVQSPDDPNAQRGATYGGGCSLEPAPTTWHTGLVTGSEACDGKYWHYWFGVVGANTATVKAHVAHGPDPDPDVIVGHLDGAPRSFFVVIDVPAPTTKPAIVFRYLDANGRVVGEQTRIIDNHGDPRGCAAPRATVSPGG